jgi:DNA polymerase V
MSVYYIGNVFAGFPSPAGDYYEEDIDLAKFLQPNKTSIYIARVQGDSMINAHIPHKSLIVIDKSAKPRNGAVIVATLNGERIVKHFAQTQAGTFLSSSNPLYSPIHVQPGMDFSIWGVVIHVIITLK